MWVTMYIIEVIIQMTMRAKTGSRVKSKRISMCFTASCSVRNNQWSKITG